MMKKKDVLKAVVLTQGEKIIAGHWSLEKVIKRNKIEKKKDTFHHDDPKDQ